MFRFSKEEQVRYMKTIELVLFNCSNIFDEERLKYIFNTVLNKSPKFTEKDWNDIANLFDVFDERFFHLDEIEKFNDDEYGKVLKWTYKINQLGFIKWKKVCDECFDGSFSFKHSLAIKIETEEKGMWIQGIEIVRGTENSIEFNSMIEELIKKFRIRERQRELEKLHVFNYDEYFIEEYEKSKSQEKNINNKKNDAHKPAHNNSSSHLIDTPTPPVDSSSRQRTFVTTPTGMYVLVISVDNMDGHITYVHECDEYGNVLNWIEHLDIYEWDTHDEMVKNHEIVCQGWRKVTCQADVDRMHL